MLSASNFGGSLFEGEALDLKSLSMFLVQILWKK